MAAVHPSKFQQTILASGLLTEDELARALNETRRANASAPGDADEDDALGVYLIRSGKLNRWQCEQLKEGRTKFTLGPYRILDSIGKGGMGHVFKGEHELLGRIEAIKVLPKEKTTPKAIENFQREIRAQARLDHPNLVRVTYADRDGDTFFFVTEFVPGADLRRLVRRFGRLTMHEAATIISQAAQAIDYAHNMGLVHRDIKPGNLLVTPEGHTKVTDLGLAWFSDENSETNARKIAGTADYIAPEVIRSPNAVGPMSDIYSLGCTLYYAVTGKVPFPGGNTAEKLRRHIEETPLNPRRFNPDLSDMFLDVLADMLEKNPNRRIRSAALVVEELRTWTLDSVAIGKRPHASPETGADSSAELQEIDPLADTAGELELKEIIRYKRSDSSGSESEQTIGMSLWNEETMATDEALEPGDSTVHLPTMSGRFTGPVRWLIIAAICAVSALVALLIIQSIFG